MLVVVALGAAGGHALAGIDASVATAPLLPAVRAEGTIPDELVEQPSVQLAAESRQDMAVAARVPEPELPPPTAFLEEPPRRYTREEVRIIAAVAGWPEHLLAEVEEVAWCESRNDPLAINGPFRGLMQVYPLWFNYSGIDISLWADPVVNMRVALVAYQYDMANGHEPWTQWQCRPGGRYVPAQDFAPPLPDPTSEVAAAGDTAQPVTPTPSPSASPAPTATPAPWETVPLWPPPINHYAAPEPSPPTPATESPAAAAP